MQCDRCGKSLPEQSKFCLSCGHPVSPTRTMAIPPGAWQAPAPGAVEAAAARASDRRRGLLTAVAALLVLVLLLAGFCLLLTRRARESAGVAQVARAPQGDDFRLLPNPRGGAPVLGGGPPPSLNGPGQGPPVTGAAPNSPGGPGVATVPPPNAGGPPVVGGPPTQPGGPNVLGAPRQEMPGAPVLGAPGRPPQGAPVIGQPPQPAPNAPPVTGAPIPAPNGPPITTAPPKEPPKAPEEPQFEDISAYLERLYRIEQTRVQLEAQLLTLVTNTTFRSALQAYTSMGSGEGNPQQSAVIQQTARDFEIVARRFDQLARAFHQTVRPVPFSCRRLHANYALALGNTPRIVRQLGVALLRMDMGAVTMVQQLGQGAVDRGFQAADQELQRLSAERKMGKPFDIGGSRRSLMLP
jgi:hypothetical protein